MKPPILPEPLATLLAGMSKDQLRACARSSRYPLAAQVELARRWQAEEDARPRPPEPPPWTFTTSTCEGCGAVARLIELPHTAESWGDVTNGHCRACLVRYLAALLEE